MPTKLGRILAVTSLLIIVTLLLSSSLAAAPDGERATGRAATPSHPSAVNPMLTSSNEAALTRLSPDLRPAALAAFDTRGDAATSAADTHLVFALIRPGTSVAKYMTRHVVSRQLGELQWVTGEVTSANLLKLASTEGVQSVTSTEAFQPLPAPGLEEMTTDLPVLNRRRVAELAAEGGKAAVLSEMQTAGADHARPAPQSGAARPDTAALPQAPADVKVVDIHRATEAHAAGYTGAGVIAAVVDSGVDFLATDLQGTQARVKGGVYDGWPYAYDTLTGLNYALAGITSGPDNYWTTASMYVHTFPIEDATCAAEICAAELTLDFGGPDWGPVALPFTWPDTSQSGDYYYTVNPEFTHFYRGYLWGMGYASTHNSPAVVIVSDATTAGVYDTVYIDGDFDQDLANDKPMTKGDELSGVDLVDANWNANPDGYWDIAAGMLTWIADGVNPPPGVGALYAGVAVPEAGRLLAFVSDSDTHGTAVASQIVAQGIMTDPTLLGSINPLFAGGADVGGVGGPILAGIAPGARVAGFAYGYNLPFDSWTLAALGFDGLPNSGDEAQIVNNSWGDSFVTEDGWDTTSRFAHYLNANFAPNTTFTAATGNGGPGYGTTTTPNGSTFIKVGASTAYSTSDEFELINPEQFTYGTMQPWSNRGPGRLGDIDPDIACVGAYGMSAARLNIWPNGQSAYGIFGGTSMANPVCVGVLALTYEAFQESHGRWPTWQEAADILSNGADDLGYNVLAQGAGNADALRATAIAAGEATYVTPGQWQVGDYRDTDYPAFPAIVHPGDTVSVPLTVHNPGDAPATVALRDVSLQRAHEISFTVTLEAGNQLFALPDYLLDITDLVEAHNPDLVSAHVMFPYSVFDADGNYASDNGLTALYYDWTDLNADGNLWVDANDNGLVEPDEIDVVVAGLGESEINRLSYAYGDTNYHIADLGGDALSRRHDGVFLGLQRTWPSWGEIPPLEVTVHLIFYQKADWEWLSLATGSVNVPANSQTDVTATMTVPAGAPLGVYEGAVEYDGQVVPVIVHVAADSATFDFGAASLDDELGDTPYDNGHLLGTTDWGWRPETGDSKLFYYDVAEGASGPGTAMVVETEWRNPEPFTPPPLPMSYLFERFENGIPLSWTNILDVGTCPWLTNADYGMDNRTDGSGLAATVSSNACLGPVDATLVTPLVDLSAAGEVWLAFHADFFGNVDWMGNVLEHGYVDISTDYGTTWINLLDLTTQKNEPVIINLSEYAGLGEVMLRFHYVATDWSFFWQIDDVGLFAADPTASYFLPTPDLTDVDTAVFRAAPDDTSTGDPAFFGPTGIEPLAASAEMWFMGGAFKFQTATGGPKEVVGGLMSDGLGLISLHNRLNAGRQLAEPFVGRAYQITVDPAPLTLIANEIVDTAPPTVSGDVEVTFTSTDDIPEGVSVQGIGISRPIEFRDETITQHDSGDPCTSDWVYGVEMDDGWLLEVSTTSAADGLDVDVFVLRDDNDGVFECDKDQLVAYSATASVEEHVRLQQPPDGRYWVLVHGWAVPGGSSIFDMDINAIQGHDLTVHHAPTGAVPANTPVTFTLSGTVPYEPGAKLEGVLLMGPADSPTTLSLPVVVTVPEFEASGLSARLNAGPEGIATGETTAVSLRVWNDSTDPEVVAVRLDVPLGLNIDLASLSASLGQAHYSVTERAVTWSGTLPGSAGLTITFDATAASHVGQVAIDAGVSGVMRDSRVQLSAPVWINVDAPARLSHMPLVAGN
jgi:hypothetical protein